MKIPHQVAISMDGNGRGAEQRGLKRTKGHQKGAETLKKISEYIFDKKVKILSVFAFSTENWKRDKEEVDYLMDLFLKSFKDNFDSLKKKGVKIIFSGVKYKLSDKVINAMNKMMKETENNANGIFNICLNYGGRIEIVEATKKICTDVLNNKISIDDITEECYNKYLFNDLEPIDLMIRTSGEYRLSNFMLWQMAYSELYFTNALWPDFDEKEFDNALDVYNNRERRFGGIKK